MKRKDRYSSWMALVTHVEPFMMEYPREEWAGVIHKKGKRVLLADKKRIGLIRGLCCTVFHDKERDLERRKAIDFLFRNQDKEFFLRFLDFGPTWFTDNIGRFCNHYVEPKARYISEFGPYHDAVISIIRLYTDLWPKN